MKAPLIPTVRNSDRRYQTLGFARGRPTNLAREYQRSKLLTAGMISRLSLMAWFT